MDRAAALFARAANARAALWVLVATTVANVLAYGYQVIMARLLVPDDYAILTALFGVLILESLSAQVIQSATAPLASPYTAPRAGPPAGHRPPRGPVRGPRGGGGPPRVRPPMDPPGPHRRRAAIDRDRARRAAHRAGARAADARGRALGRGALHLRAAHVHRRPAPGARVVRLAPLVPYPARPVAAPRPLALCAPPQPHPSTTC